jgi:hypothetical protein
MKDTLCMLACTADVLCRCCCCMPHHVSRNALASETCAVCVFPPLFLQARADSCLWQHWDDQGQPHDIGHTRPALGAAGAAASHVVTTGRPPWQTLGAVCGTQVGPAVWARPCAICMRTAQMGLQSMFLSRHCAATEEPMSGCLVLMAH